jgi:hypothetical protein
MLHTLQGNGRPRHVPYRDSKLTRILQPALAGNARMAIITTISPAASCADNSRAALHFANAAKKMVMAPQVRGCLHCVLAWLVAGVLFEEWGS